MLKCADNEAAAEFKAGGVAITPTQPRARQDGLLPRGYVEDIDEARTQLGEKCASRRPSDRAGAMGPFQHPMFRLPAASHASLLL